MDGWKEGRMKQWRKHFQKWRKKIIIINPAYLLFKNNELPQHLSCPSAIMAIRSPRKSASSLISRQNEYILFNKLLTNFWIRMVFLYFQERNKQVCQSADLSIVPNCKAVFFSLIEIKFFTLYCLPNLHKMGRQNDGLPSSVFHQQVPGGSTGVRVHARGRLVQKYDLWADNQRDGTATQRKHASKWLHAGEWLMCWWNELLKYLGMVI